MKISTSILNASNRIDSVLNLNRTNTSFIHIDVMDGKFVDDIQFNINEIVAVNRVSKYPLDIHLMVNDPIKYIIELKDMNISYITFHLEIRRSKEKIISKIKEMGYKVGISIKPDTDIKKLEPYLKDIDMILVMSVEPGRGGQKFLDSTIDRINDVKKLIDDGGYDIQIEVDGGINDLTITNLSNVDIAVVGSYIVKSDNYYYQIEKLIKKDDSRLNRGISNLLIIVGTIFIFLSFVSIVCNNCIVKSIYLNYLMFLIGYFVLAAGMFVRPIYKLAVNNVDGRQNEQKLDKSKLSYQILFWIGVLSILFILLICLYYCLSFPFDLGMIITTVFLVLFGYLPVLLLGILFVVVGLVRFSEIKKLSKK